MKYFEQRFTLFLNTSLRILFLLILIGCIALPIAICIKLPAGDLLFVLFMSAIIIITYAGIAYAVYKDLKIKKNYKKSILKILGISCILRILWILTVNSQPVSDFSLIYNAGKEFAGGNYWVFKGISYMARFPHLTMLTIYLGLFQKIFANALLFIKFVNAALSVVSVYIIYLIGTELFDDKEKGIFIALSASLFPPFIMYTSVVCSENLAMPFFLGSIYIFILVTKRKKNIMYFIFSALLLSAGNLFRMVAYVLLIAYIMYLFIFWDRKKFAKSCALIVIAFFIPLYLANYILLNSGITENPLWKGKEPTMTSVLKGTNINSIGMWNEEDSKLPGLYNYDYEAVNAAAKSIIKYRLTTTPIYKLAGFYIIKFIAQWSLGDFAAVRWANDKLELLSTTADLGTIAALFSQLIFIVVILYSYRGLFNHKQYMENKIVNLFYIIFCGYGLLYLITEQQPRYGYIASWVFIILVFTCSDVSFAKRRSKARYINTDINNINT
jgi:hypothetical protein